MAARRRPQLRKRTRLLAAAASVSWSTSSRSEWALCVAGVAGLALTLAGAGVSASTTRAVTPGAVLDQSNPYRASPCIFSGFVSDTDHWEAQTFTSGVTGTLADLVLFLKGSGGQLAVTITRVDAGGQPLADATPLASTSVVVSPSTAYADVNAGFSAPAGVEAGKQYAIVVRGPVTWAADLGSSVQDPNGTPCADGSYSGGRGWPAPVVGAEADFFFQTYVVPTPSGTPSGTVLVNGKPFTGGPIPFGSKVDVTKGKLKLRSSVGTLTATGGGGIAAQFIMQRATVSAKPIIELRLSGGKFGVCSKRHTSSSLGAAAKRPPSQTVRRLYTKGKGSFRTRGRYASASVRGTDWLTADRCDGTLVKTRQGTVAVRDLRRKKTILVKAGKSYLAKKP